MKRNIIFPALAVASLLSAQAQHKVNLTKTNGEIETFDTDKIESIEFDDSRVIVNHNNGAPSVYDGTVTGVSFIKSIAGNVQIIEAGGWFETSYVKWQNIVGATNYHVFVKEINASTYTRLDYQLVRNYGSYGRADMVGLKEGQYIMRVVPVINGTLMEGMASETGVLNVRAHDRGGFAHFNYTAGIGAYKNDGTLKDGAKVFYVTAETAKSITTDVVTGSKGQTTTCQGLQTIIDAYQKGYDKTPVAFRLIGRIDRSDLDHISSSAEGLQIKGKGAYSEMNITVEGIGDDAVCHNFGFLLRNASSVELRNFALMYFMDDAVSMDTDNSRLWLHNLDIFYGQKGGAADQAKGDGSLDIKNDSQYVTMSYNHFWDSGKSSLCGMKSESGPNYITYHHNWFDHSDSRHPRIRTMSVHVYNNYYDGVSKYGVGATTGADAFVEANYFRDCKYPILTSLQGSDVMGEGSTPNGKGTFSSEAGGSIKAYGNVMKGWYFYRPWSETSTVEFDCYEVTARDEKVPSSVVAKSGGDTYSNWDTDPKLMYQYSVHSAGEVPGVLKGVYGAGRINHGDFRWTFNNNVQDKNYDVISALSDEIKSYRGKLVGFYEGSTSFGDNGGFTGSGGDAEAGVDYPFGDGNMANGGSKPVDPDPVEPGAVFIANADGTDYYWFDASATEQVAAWYADGTLEGGTHKPDYAGNGSVANAYVGSIEIPKGGGTLTISCPSISALKIALYRSGSYKGSVSISKDGGATWSEISTLNQKKGNVTLDLSAAATCQTPALIRIKNDATGGLHVHGLFILKAK